MPPSSARPRPGEGHNLTIVSLDPGQSESTSGRLVFDRGRGLVIDVVPRPGFRFAKGLRLMVMYTVQDTVYWFPAHVDEVLRDDRLYVLPTAAPAELEKREFIRAETRLPAALVRDLDTPVADELPVCRVELSASGFRWWGKADVRPGDRVRLDIRLPDEPRTLSLAAEVVRADAVKGGDSDVAGRFLRPTPAETDAILACVFRTRQHELGLLDLESSFDR